MMVVICCVLKCSNRLAKTSVVVFFRLPFDPDRRYQWTTVIGRANSVRWDAFCSQFDCVATIL